MNKRCNNVFIELVINVIIVNQILQCVCIIHHIFTTGGTSLEAIAS